MNSERPTRRAAENNQFITTSKRSKIVSESISKSKISTTGILGSSNDSAKDSFVKWAEDNPTYGGLPRSFRENKPGEPFKNPVGDTPILLRRKGLDGYGCCNCGMYVKYVDKCQHRCGNTGEVVHAWCTTTDQPDYGDSLSYDKPWCKMCFFPWSTAVKNKALIDAIAEREAKAEEESEKTPIFTNEEVEDISNNAMIEILDGNSIAEVGLGIGMESPFTLPHQEVELPSDTNKDEEPVFVKDLPKKKGLLSEVIQCASGPWNGHNEIESMVKVLNEDQLWDQVYGCLCLLAVNEIATEEAK